MTGLAICPYLPTADGLKWMVLPGGSSPRGYSTTKGRAQYGVQL